MPSLQNDSMEIKRITQTLVRILNSRDFSYKNDDGQELLAHVAPDFEARFDTQPHKIDFDEQTEIWRQDAREYPSLRFAVLEMTAQIRRRSNTGSVYLKLALTGMSDVQYQGACELNFKYSGERWLLYRHVTMRGLLPDDSTVP
jgi:hypothetical protein